MNKYKEILNSPTFHLICAILLIQILKIFNIITGPQMDQLATALQQFFAGVGGVRVLQKVATPKPTGNTTTVTMPSNVSSVSAKTSKKK